MPSLEAQIEEHLGPWLLFSYVNSMCALFARHALYHCLLTVVQFVWCPLLAMLHLPTKHRDEHENAFGEILGTSSMVLSVVSWN